MSKIKNRIIIKSPVIAVVRNKETGFLLFESAVGTADEVHEKAMKVIGKDTDKYEISLYLA